MIATPRLPQPPVPLRHLQRLPSELIPATRLPNMASIWAVAREGGFGIPLPVRPALQVPVSPTLMRRSRSATESSITPPARTVQVKRPKAGWELHHVFMAIDKNDIDVLGDIREKNFGLLLQAQDGTGMTPLKYAMNQGARAQTTTLTLVGFLSSWVNRLDDKALQGPEGSPARLLQRALRTNLRLAVDFGLRNNHFAPLASYVQILVMSERASWLENHVAHIASIVSGSGSPAEAFRVASTAFDQLIKTELHTKVLEVSDYRNNAITDLVMMGCAKALGNVESISPSCFGRDERVFNEFTARLRDASVNRPRPRRSVRDFCDAVHEAMGRTSLGLAAKVALLQEKCKA